MNFIIKSIPNTITICNLLSGCAGIMFAVNGDLQTAFFCMLASLFFDFFDGFSARLLKAYSEMGKELDSLADMVSFGVLPSIIVYALGVGWWGFAIAAFSALRLAKFNIDTRQTEQFIGLATPACAIFFGAIGYLSQSSESAFITANMQGWVLIAFSIVFSLLLVSEIPMFSLKFKSYKFSKNIMIYSFIILSITSLILVKIVAIPYIIIGYILLSIIQLIINKLKAGSKNT